jgi:hypothetical protein
MRNIPQELPSTAMEGASFADSLSKKAESQGMRPADLFIALAGLIYGLSPKIGAECLIALEGAIDGDRAH